MILIVILILSYLFQKQVFMNVFVSTKLITEIVLYSYMKLDKSEVVYSKINGRYYLEIILIVILNTGLFMGVVLRRPSCLGIGKEKALWDWISLCILLWLYHDYRSWRTLINEKFIYCRGKLFNVDDVRASSIDMNNNGDRLKIIFKDEAVVEIDV